MSHKSASETGLFWWSGRCGLLVAAMGLAVVLAACGSNSRPAGQGASEEPAPVGMPVLRLASNRIAKGVPVLRTLCDEFEREHGCRVEVVNPNLDVTDMLNFSRQYLESQSPEVDLYDVDVIWPSILGEHLMDLSGTDGLDTREFVPTLIENNTVGGRLVAIPWYVDMGLLYVRADLMAEAGTTVPKTYDELRALEAPFRELRQRRAVSDPGTTAPYPLALNLDAREGLTCMALEWLAAAGAGLLVDSSGTVTLDKARAEATISAAREWVGTIVPPEAVGYGLTEIQAAFERGEAAMMRNWTHAYALVRGPDSPIRDRVEVHPLPAGPAGSFHVLGGFQLAVSRYTRHPDLARKLAMKITSHQGQKLHALEGGFFPARPALWKDPEVMRALPHLQSLNRAGAVEQLIVRPSRVAGTRYNEVSSFVFEEVSRALKGEQGPGESVQKMTDGVRTALRR